MRLEQCIVEDCAKLQQARGLCSSHYYRLRTYSDPLGLPAAKSDKDPICKAPKCSRNNCIAGYCHAHYQQLRLKGKILDRPIRGSQAKLGSKYPDRTHGYVFIVVAPNTPGAKRPHSPNGKWIMAEHRWVMQEHLGRALRKDEDVHHKNGDRKDNRLENLELWSHSHPRGQRITDLVAWAKEIIERYDSEIAR